jgi:hypothetical protein
LRFPVSRRDRVLFEIPVVFDSSISVSPRSVRKARRRAATSASTFVVSEAAVIARFNIGFPEPATKVVVPSAFGAPSLQEVQMSTKPNQRPHGQVGTKEPRFAAFEARNFRRYFIGQIISSVGSWTQALAVTWLVLDLTDRSDQLGIVMALQFLPMLLLGAPAGILADKIDNRRLLIATSTASGLVALGFGTMVATGRTSMWMIRGSGWCAGGGGRAGVGGLVGGLAGGPRGSALLVLRVRRSGVT